MRAFCAAATSARSPSQARAHPGRRTVPGDECDDQAIIAAIHGHCNGGGLEQALACDIRVAAQDAQFGLARCCSACCRVAGGTQRLPRLIPLGRALEMLYTGARIDAAEAWRLGLVDHVVPRANLISKCESIATAICRGAPLAVAKIREAALRGSTWNSPTGSHSSARTWKFLRTTADSKEGAVAFAEKRPPRWQGR